MEDKSHDNLYRCRKISESIQYQFVIKVLKKVGIEVMYFNIIKVIYEKPTVNILNSIRMKAFPLRTETRQGCPSLPLLFRMVVKSKPE